MLHIYRISVCQTSFVLPKIHDPSNIEQTRTNSSKRSKETIQIVEGSLEVKLPTIWTVEKQR